jgi:hypothetical protein
VGRAGRVAIAAAGAVVGLLVVAQLVLPGVAERRVRHRLERDGTVQRVEIHAVPAIKLMWHRADRVVVRMGRGRGGPGHLADRLAEARDTDELDARVGELRVLTLRLRDARLTKRGDELRGQATVAGADLRAALPPGFDARPISSGGGSLVFEGTAELLGRRFSGQVVVGARDGRLQLVPNIPFGGFLTLTLFADPRIEVQGVSARPAPGGFTVAARARLR